MADDLKQHIASLRAEIQRIAATHPEDKDRLAKLVADLERAAHADRATLTSQVREAVRHFEAEHPTVTSTLNRVLASLDGVGI
jgi:phytoene dehydrogenase-like protein